MPNCEWCGDTVEELYPHKSECYVLLKINGGQEDLIPERHETLALGQAPGDYEFEEKMGFGHPVQFSAEYDLA